MKIFKKISILSLTAIGALLVVSCSSNSNSSNESSNTTGDSNSLRVTLTDGKLSDASRQNMIKAEYLIKNDGYKDSDEVSAIITLNSASMMELYSSYGNTYDSVSDFYESPKGIVKRRDLEIEQKKIINELIAAGYFDSVEQTYTAILNGFSVKTTYGKFKELEECNLIKQAILGDAYNLPTTTLSTESKAADAVTNVVDVYDTGIFNSSNVEYNGEGTSVAILDSGFDCSHTVFQNQPEKEMISLDLINSKLSDLNASKLTSNLKAEDLYYSKKIPYTYDYADKDYDVNPYDSEHGTHVAGIIGGKDDTITGVATNTQLVLMKVFADTSGGAETDDILAALNDAVILGVDCINMSLGTSCGFNREADNDAINETYDAVEAAGISLITAASNDYSSGMGGPNGNTNKTSNPDSGTVGSPSSYTSTLSVASISGRKSPYLVANDSDTFFFLQSRTITSKEYDFIQGLKDADPEFAAAGTKTYEYITIPGTGSSASYTSVNVKGKIAVVKRGDNSFEDKAKLAKRNGALAIIIYNNVEGDIAMTISDTTHIPAISILKEDGLKLAEKSSGTITVSDEYLAGPFMSDFSSWGPTPSLELKPEITAHGGEILSSIPGGGYDKMSGTSMASPNMCGIVVLIRQYLKEKYPNITRTELQNLTNSLLMSTATIALNEEGNPYTPRKQGAGLANLANATKSNAYISVENSTKPKIELGDDKNRTGSYEMKYTINNISNKALEYTLDLDVMTESVSSSDSNYVAEKSYMLDNTFKAYVNNVEVTNKKVTVPANGSLTVTYKYELNDTDRAYIESNFAYGIYVEGFAKAVASDSEVSLNVPFLAFYGDWTEAPLFDKTYYEVESEAHNGNIDAEDKIQADYWATRPYGSYMYNYIMPLGTYIYTLDESKYDAIPGSEDHIAISSTFGTIDGISTIYAGCLRNAKTMHYTITDDVTGKVVYDFTDYNCHKAFGYNGSAMPYYKYIRQTAESLGLQNNRTYTFNMLGTIDYGDGGLETNARNSFSFNFTMDDEAPIIKNASFEKEYDDTLKKDRYYVTLTVYDNHYVQAVTPVIFTSKSSYTTLSENPIPVYGNKGEDATVKIEVTDYMDLLSSDALVNNAISFNIDDYALNSNIYVVELPGTTGELSFRENGETDGTALNGLTANVNTELDLTKYLASTTEVDKSYFKYLTWSSSNTSIADVNNGIVIPYKRGAVNITCTDKVTGKTATIRIQVLNASSNKSAKRSNYTGDAEINKITFDYFDTTNAYALAGETSKIGSTGDRVYVSSLSGLEMYPGESVKLHAYLDPWYADISNATWSSTNTKVATVDEDGNIKALKEGTAYISLKKNNSTISASIKITVMSEFVIEGRTLTAYKGLGGDVVIPDDKGILYIGEYAFALYTTDRTIQNPDDDDDYNKTPGTNSTIKSVTIPEGVEDIKKYAFYNCTALETVTLPSTIRYVREYAFSYNTNAITSDGMAASSSLANINLKDVEVIGAHAFANCTKLTSLDLSTCYAIGNEAFLGCTGLTTVDISKLRNSGSGVFKNCTNLTSYVTDSRGQTRLGEEMFYNSGLTTAAINSTQIPARAFANCAELKSIVVNGNVVTIGDYAFANNPKLESIIVNGSVEYLNQNAMANNVNLLSVTLPNSIVNVQDGVLSGNIKLEEVKFQKNTYLKNLSADFLKGTNVSTFDVASDNASYQTNGNLLLEGNKIILAAPAALYGDYTIPTNVEEIGQGAFSGITSIKTLVLPEGIKLGAYAFANCVNLEEVTFPSNLVISDYAFALCTKLITLNNIENIKSIGSHSFEQIGSGVGIDLILGSDTNIGSYAFAQARIKSIKLGDNTKVGDYAFNEISTLARVIMPDAATVTIGAYAFANCYSLEAIDLSKLVGTVGDYAFSGCGKIVFANLENVEHIGAYAFANCYGITKISIPNVKTIADHAFTKLTDGAMAPQFTEIELPSTLTSIGAYAFAYANKLTGIVIPKGITNISDYAFAACTSLTNVSLPQSVVEVSSYAFAGCSSLTNINLENVKLIKEGAFANTLKLDNISLTSVEEIGDGAFANSSLNVSLETPSLKTVGSYAFQGSGLKAINALKLQNIAEGAFYQTALKSFTLTSNIAEIGQLVFYNSNDLQEINYVDDTGATKNTGKINDYAYVDNGILYTYLTPKKLMLVSVPAALNIETLTVLEGTHMIDIFAGNANKNIKNIVLPDSLRVIGAYGFYGLSKLEQVEFRSVNAPSMEAYYTAILDRSSSKTPGQNLLTEEDPGYAIIHKYYNAFGTELYYANFIDAIGRNNPIKMVLPKNDEISGYDSILFEVYFGGVDNATRSDYQAMDSNAVKYLELIEKIMNKNILSLEDDSLISNCGLAYNNISTDLTRFGYTEEELKNMENSLIKAQKEIREIKYKTASLEVKALQAEIDSLNTSFTIDRLGELQAFAERLNKLKLAERNILDLTKYNALMASYNAYLETLKPAINSVNGVLNSTYNYTGAAAITVLSLISVITVAGVCLVKKFY